jgi:hypothetical protein
MLLAAQVLRPMKLQDHYPPLHQLQRQLQLCPLPQKPQPLLSGLLLLRWRLQAVLICQRQLQLRRPLRQHQLLLLSGLLLPLLLLRLLLLLLRSQLLPLLLPVQRHLQPARF